MSMDDLNDLSERIDHWKEGVYRSFSEPCVWCRVHTNEGPQGCWHIPHYSGNRSPDEKARVIREMCDELGSEHRVDGWASNHYTSDWQKPSWGIDHLIAQWDRTSRLMADETLHGRALSKFLFQEQIDTDPHAIDPSKMFRDLKDDLLVPEASDAEFVQMLHLTYRLTFVK
jgi:hypothetical protein